MNKALLPNIVRFVALVLFQGLILRRLELTGGLWDYIHPMVYPLFIIMLPIRMPSTLVILLGFAVGMIMDVFYASLGIHAAATVFLGFIRKTVINAMEPRGGYNLNDTPTRSSLGMRWWITYVAILMGIHQFFYFSVEAFTFVYIVDILLSTLFSFVVSMAFVYMIQLLFDPSE